MTLKIGYNTDMTKKKDVIVGEEAMLKGGCCAVVLVFNLLFGGFCLNFCLGTLFGTSLHWLVAGILGLFLGEITIPLAFILWVIALSGVATPFFR